MQVSRINVLPFILSFMKQQKQRKIKENLCRRAGSKNMFFHFISYFILFQYNSIVFRSLISAPIITTWFLFFRSSFTIKSHRWNTEKKKKIILIVSWHSQQCLFVLFVERLAVNGRKLQFFASMKFNIFFSSFLFCRGMSLTSITAAKTKILLFSVP